MTLVSNLTSLALVFVYFDLSSNAVPKFYCGNDWFDTDQLCSEKVNCVPCQNGIDKFACPTVRYFFEKNVLKLPIQRQVEVVEGKELCPICPAGSIAEKTLLFIFPDKTAGIWLVKDMEYFTKDFHEMFSRNMTTFKSSGMNDGFLFPVKNASETLWIRTFSHPNHILMTLSTSDPPIIDHISEEIGVFYYALQYLG